MSHASLIVALSPHEISEHGGIEEAIANQMEPFDEDGEWFADGSRWDWWQIGGRYSATFAEDGYDPETDPENIETCRLCAGTGKRTDGMAVANGCNGCNGNGQKVKWPSEWRDVGNVAKRADIAHLENTLTASAFLKDHSWCEIGRLGFFGCTTLTECEVKANERGENYEGRCIHTCEKTDAKIVSFSESSDDGRWNDLFWARFIRNLPDDTTLVTVDFHV